MARDNQPCFASPSVAVTEAVGERIGAELGAGCLISLVGELGSGKTALVRGLALGLGIHQPVGSPSFTLMNEYEGRVPLYHFDAWMRGREAALLGEGAGEFLDGVGVAAVEWGDRVAQFLPTPHLELCLWHRGPTERRLAVRVIGAASGGDRTRQGRLESACRSVAGTPGLRPTPFDDASPPEEQSP
ncbi:MAG: tRNA (adenosine(37)-N6)-threonylcarbamoyltransferase complex ATPase subunit type 1 TsaE [Planctomycetes bacterium]|nr:tRNA (adenosine(37)-N6)-threonylcarbamoyltransferase complex ATPase subunit type 1 TsaE [Planctomycetota bacterium]